MKNGHTINVLYLCPNGYLGGAEKFVLNVNTDHLKSHLIKSSILYFNDGIGVEEAKKRGINCSVLKNKFRFRNPLKFLKAIFEIRKFVKENGIDIVQTTMSYGHIVGALACMFLNVKVIWFHHGPAGSLVDRVAHLFPNQKILYPTRYTLEAHRSDFPLITGHWHMDEVVHYGVPDLDINQSEVDRIRSEWGSDGNFILTTAGRITDWKGHDTIIKAIADIKLEHPELYEKVNLLVLGDANMSSDLAYKDSLVKMVEEGGMSNVHFLGFCANVSDYLAASDIFIHASKIPEPWGLVVAESMAVGTLTIGCSKGGIDEMLIDKQTGLTFDSTAPRASEDLKLILIDVLQKLVSGNTEDLKKLSLAGQKKISQDFSMQRLMNQLEEIYSRKNT